MGLFKYNIFILLILLVFSLPAYASDSALRIEGVRYGMTGEKTRIVLDLNRKADYRVFALDKPFRIVLDLPGARWGTPSSRFVMDSVLKAYRSGPLEGGQTRVVFDISRPAIIENAFFMPKDGLSKDRIVIDLAPASQNLFAARLGEIHGRKDLKVLTTSPAFREKPSSELASVSSRAIREASPPSLVPAAAKIAVPLQKPFDRKYTIVVDAGHGGGDPGAVSSGVKEKDVTLAIGRELKRRLEETGRYKVVLTRSNDTYIPLRERVDISRRVGGDLFISIHADKLDRKDVHGAAIYTLSEKASDAETARLADGENNAGVVAGVDLREESADVADILLDLAMREKMNESKVLARIFHEAFILKNVRLLPNSHRSAGFAVLKAPDVPAVLIETGFLSNREEAKLLSSAAFQRKIALAIVDGTDAYFRKMQSLRKI